MGMVPSYHNTSEDFIFVSGVNIPNFSLCRSCLKVCVGVGGGFRVSTMSNLNPSCIELELGFGFDN